MVQEKCQDINAFEKVTIDCSYIRNKGIASKYYFW
jgi:hypothetical protein